MGEGLIAIGERQQDQQRRQHQGHKPTIEPSGPKAVAQHDRGIEEIAARQDGADAEKLNEFTCGQPLVPLDDDVIGAGLNAAETHEPDQQEPPKSSRMLT